MQLKEGDSPLRKQPYLALDSFTLSMFSVLQFPQLLGSYSQGIGNMDLLSMEFSVGISQQGFHKLHSTFQILLLQLVLCCFFKRGNFAISCLVLSACFRVQLRVISQFHPQWSPLECLSFSFTYRLQESNFPSYSLELPGSLKHLLSFSCSKRIQ